MAAEGDFGLSEGASFLDNVWYCAAPSAAVRRGRMKPVTIAGQPVLLARGHDGDVFALRDICPHRGIPLSCGRFDGREVECGYHGWRFGADGRCTEIPAVVEGQKLDVSRIRTRAWPVVERHGLIWLFLGDEAPDHEPPQVPDFDPAARPSLLVQMDFACHVDHAVIGLMDPAHGPFVHKSWFWRSRRSIHEKAKRMGPSELGFTMLRHRPSRNSFAYRILGGAPETEIAFRLPGARLEHIRAGRHVVCGLTAVTPETPDTTRVLHAIWWTWPVLTVLKPILYRFARTFIDQDRRMVALQQQGLRYKPSLMLIRDSDTPARWYYQLKNELVRSRAAGRPFENPVRETTLRWRS